MTKTLLVVAVAGAVETTEWDYKPVMGGAAPGCRCLWCTFPDALYAAFVLA